jgi:hypothetical protein
MVFPAAPKPALTVQMPQPPVRAMERPAPPVNRAEAGETIRRRGDIGSEVFFERQGRDGGKMNDRYGEAWSPRRMTRRETILAVTAALLATMAAAARGENVLARRGKRKNGSRTKNNNNSNATSVGQGGPGGAGGAGGTVIIDL